MTRTSSFLTLAALVLAVPLAGQTRSADAPATVEIIARPLTLANTQGLDFGSHFASEGLINVPRTYAEWSGATDVGTTISIEFTKPGVLTRGDGGETVVISYGDQSATYAETGSPDVIVNPNTPQSFTLASSGAADGTFKVRLGSNSGPASAFVTVNLAGKPAGTYSGTITLTVAVL